MSILKFAYLIISEASFVSMVLCRGITIRILLFLISIITYYKYDKMPPNGYKFSLKKIMKK